MKKKTSFIINNLDVSRSSAVSFVSFFVVVLLILYSELISSNLEYFFHIVSHPFVNVSCVQVHFLLASL